MSFREYLLHNQALWVVAWGAQFGEEFTARLRTIDVPAREIITLCYKHRQSVLQVFHCTRKNCVYAI